ncbi:MAG: hypothetical protein ABSA80_15845 [Terriglobales bacterium]|jgi:hypothetical protein
MSSSLDKFSDNLCAQRKANGDPCQSPALRGERFCHYHKVTGMPKINIDNSPSGHAYLPVFEDAVSIQSAISDVCEMMLHRRIETKEASILLYAMQVASTNMAHLNGDKGQRKHKSPKKNQNPNSSPGPGAPLSTDASTAHPSSTTSSSAPEPLPPGTIQACEQGGRTAFE